MNGRHRALAVIAACMIAAASVPTVQASGTLDQQQENHEHSVAASPLSSYLAQTFTAGVSGTLDAVTLALCLDSPPTYTDTANVRIESVADGLPTGTVLATAAPVTLYNALCQWVPFAFAAPAQVVNGTQYAIVMLAPTPYWGFSPEASGDLYAGGQALSNGFVYSDPSDFAFRTYVTGRGRPACLVSNERTRQGSRSLQDSIDAAAPGDTLIVKGTCVGTGVTPGFGNANFVIHRDLTIRGVANKAFGTPTLDGGLNGPVVEIRSGLTVTLIGLTITNGGSANYSFGGLFNEGSVVALIDSTVTGNHANTAGGIGNGHFGTMTLTNSTVSNNTSQCGGGGIYNAGTMTLASSTVIDNTSLLCVGGGIFNFRVDTIASSGFLTVTSSTISGNSAAQGGGGIFNQGSQYGLSFLTLTDSTVSDNTAGNGGGIYNLGTAEIADSTVSDNVAIYLGGFSGHGGGIVNVRGYLAQPANLTVTNSTVSGNAAMAGSGGGIVNGFSFGESSVLTLTDSTVSGNTSGFSGGGIFNRGILTFQGSTVSVNVAQYGGGIFGDGSLTFISAPTTIGGNTGTVYWGGIANTGGTVAGGCPTVLGQGVPPSTTTTGFVVYDPPNLSAWEFDKDYNGFTC